MPLLPACGRAELQAFRAGNCSFPDQSWSRGLKRAPGNDVARVGGAGEIAGLFQGAMVSMMILIPDNALSISPCTRETSAFRNVCSSWSSDVSSCSPSIETDVDRAMEDLIRSALFPIRGAFLGIPCCIKLLIAFSTSGVSGGASSNGDFTG
jgi:hypothetical protein